jgi:ribosomal protein S2
LEIPIAAIVDSNSLYVEHVNYPIIGNNKSFEATFLYLNLIINSVLKGQQKELLKILRIV